MFITPPERVVFESKDAIVDYVTRGLPPSKKNFERVMAAVQNPMTDDQVSESTSDQVVISERLFFEGDNQAFEEVLRRVYKNNVRKRNITIGAVAAVIGGVVVVSLIRGRKDDEKSTPEVKDAERRMALEWDDDHDNFRLVDIG